MKKAIRLYVLITQFIFTMVLGGILGAIYGKSIDPEGTSETLFAGLGLVIALFISMLLIIQFVRNERLTEKDD